MRRVSFVVIMELEAKRLRQRQQGEGERPMKYMMIIAGPDDGWAGMSEADQTALYETIGTWWGERAARGEILDGYELQPPSTATTVRRSATGEVTVTDGPFVETKEMIAGYGILEVPDLDAAIRLAASWPGPDTLEIRPIVETRADRPAD